jgi:membrane-associated protein
VTLRSPITNVDHYLLPIIAVVIVASLIPTGVGLLRNRPVHRRVR